MSAAKVIRWSGLVSIAAGAWTIVVLLFELGEAAGPWVYALSSVLMIFTLFAIYAVQVAASGLWGLVGFVLALSSEVLMMVEGDPQDPMGMLAGALYALGLIALAVSLDGDASFRAGFRLVVRGIVIGLPSYTLPSLGQLLLTGATVAFGLCFSVAGYGLWTEPAATGRASVIRQGGSRGEARAILR